MYIFYLDDNTYLPGAIFAAIYFNHPFMHKVHICRGHVAYVCWIYTVYVQNNLSLEFSKKTFFII